MPINRPPHGDDLRRAGAFSELLKVSAQDNANMTVRVNRGGYWKSETVWVETTNTNSAAMVAPVSGARWYIVCLRDNGFIGLVTGVASSNPVLPEVTANWLPLAAVYVVTGATKVTNDMIYDVRPFFRAGSRDMAHADLLSRNAADAHTIAAVTGLQAALDAKVSYVDQTEALANKSDIDGTPAEEFTLNKDASGLSGTTVTLWVNRGADADVGLRWNESVGAWQYTNDGIDWFSFSIATVSNGSVSYASLNEDLQETLDEKAAAADVYTKVEVDDALDLKADASALTTGLSGKANTVHNHDDLYYTEAEVDAALDLKADQSALTTGLSGKANTVHSHDDLYYTEAEVTSFLAGKAAAVHNHDDLYYTEAEVDAALDLKADQSALTTGLSGKANTVHAHDDLYYTEAEVTSFLSAKAAKVGADDIEITDFTKGVILRSPDNSRWRITVDNSGVISATSI
jgi:hypothetical protein